MNKLTVKKEQEFEIPYKDPRELANLMQQAPLKIAELLTGAFAVGKTEAILMGGRIIQGALKGQMLQQVGKELKNLIDSGKIREDYADKKYGIKSFSDLLCFIDSEEVPDRDRFDAVKALFYATITANEGEEVLRYQLFKISQKLNSAQLITLKAACLVKDGPPENRHSEVTAWRREVAKLSGHNSVGLVENGEEDLVQLKLLGKTVYADNSGISNAGTGRLTDLGVKLVELILEYENFGNVE